MGASFLIFKRFDIHDANNVIPDVIETPNHTCSGIDMIINFLKDYAIDFYDYIPYEDSEEDPISFAKLLRQKEFSRILTKILKVRVTDNKNLDYVYQKLDYYIELIGKGFYIAYSL